MTSYGGFNGFVQNYYEGGSTRNWENDNPYGNAIKDIINKGGLYRYASNKQKGKLEQVVKKLP